MSHSVLLDAGPIVALFNRAERFHEIAFDALSSTAYDFITCEPVITEACFLLRRKPSAVRDVLENVSARHFQIVYALAERAREVNRLIKKYADRPMSLADACLVDLAMQRQCARILTFDSDFRVYRWGRNRPFELMLDV